MKNWIWKETKRKQRYKSYWIWPCYLLFYYSIKSWITNTSKDELTNDQQSKENVTNNEINKTKEKDIQEINFNNGLNNNKQTENNNEINTFSKYEKQFEELTYVKIIIDDKNNNWEKKRKKNK